MRYFLDTEFIESERRVDLVSVAVACEDGREFYAISTEFDPALANEFVQTVVLPLLEPREDPAWKSRRRILAELIAFVGTDPEPVFWCWGGAAYDWWAVVQLFPLADRVPDGWKYSAYDVMQLVEARGLRTDPPDPRLPPSPVDAHHALVDARWTRARFEYLQRPTSPTSPTARRPLVLTGGPAVGKTTTGRAVAQAREDCAFIDVDDIRQLVVAGGRPPWAGDAGRAQQELGVRNACSLAQGFLGSGFDVVIADVLTPRTAGLYRDALPGCLLVRLAIRVEEARERARSRPRWITDAEFDELYRLDRDEPPQVDVVVEVGGSSVAEQLAAVGRVWAEAR